MFDYDKSLTRNEKKKPPFPKPWRGRAYWRLYDKLIERDAETAAERQKRLTRRAALQQRPRRPHLKSSRLDAMWERERDVRRAAQCRRRKRDERGRFV